MLINKSTIFYLNIKNGTKFNLTSSTKLINKFKNDYLIKCTVFSKRFLSSNDNENNNKNKETSSKDKGSNEKLLIANAPVLKGLINFI